MALQTYTVTVRIRGERPGIGAVVAMVAAARMVLGWWHNITRQLSDGSRTHWDFVHESMTALMHSVCGSSWHGDGHARDLSDVDCPECLAIARQAGLLTDAS